MPEYFVYYTWIDPLKPREMTVICDNQLTTIELSVSYHLNIVNSYFA